MFSVQFTRTALKHFKTIPRQYQLQAAKAIDRLRQDPQLGEPLKGKLKGKCKLRFGHYRVVYQILRDRMIILVFDVRHRKDIYR